MAQDDGGKRGSLGSIHDDLLPPQPPKDHPRPLRPLLPSSTIQEPIPRRSRPARKPQVSLACEACRQRKAKCNGLKPRCSPCRVKGIDCTYRTSTKDTLKQQSDELAKTRATFDIFHALQSRPDADAAKIFQSIRDGNDPESVTRYIEAGDLLQQMKLVPQTHRGFIFPYRSQMPAYLMTPDNDYLNTLAHEWPRVSGTRHTFMLEDTQPVQYLMPYGAAELVEPRIDRCVPSRWTAVSSDDNLMREILRAYFLYEYSSVPCFQKDLFLDDMLAGTGRFCTSLLVNAVLAHGCHCYSRFPNRAEYWYPHSLGYKFLGEAKRLLELDLTRDGSTTSVQAILILNCLLNFSGLDKIGETYMQQAAAMGRNLGLLESTKWIEDADLTRSRIFTAWCLFRWQSIMCYHMLIDPGSDGVPHFALPDPERHAEWYGEISVQYPTSKTVVHTRLAQCFKAQCDMAVLLHRTAMDYFAAQPGNGKNVSMHQIRETISGLQAWYDTLPECLNPSNIVFPKELDLHMQYFAVMMQLCDMPTSGNASPTAGAPQFGPVATSRSMLGKYKTSFETIIRLYYLRHGFETPDVLLTLFLSSLAFISIDRLKPYSAMARDARPQSSLDALSNPIKEEVWSTLILAQKGLAEQGQSYYLPQTVSHLVLCNLDEDLASLLRQYADGAVEDADARHVRAQHIEAQFPVYLRNLTESPDQQRMNVLVQEYAGMSLAQSPDSRH
ncbi:hypothetical protein S7711_05135 [Stachybotrys chartarum IBT 7711]|uniref:Zn(2)-C6 fungal-type domain-containing protein n=1 Tax=Stachybotrys chartarum (strain CBS 109288 / IBT 7711) TaxID=1280523 RepID=A0A084B4I1_STACB|nr:hypothetical protein S7711_05135 [Stachybotrys chartarum IBT 7711]